MRAPADSPNTVMRRGSPPPDGVSRHKLHHDIAQLRHLLATGAKDEGLSELADHLDTEEGAPLISLARHSYEMHEGEEQLVDFLQVYYHPERFQYRMDLKIED